MPDPEVSKELGGAATWFLGLMAAAITALASGNAMQWKHSNKVYGYRLAERDTLNTALSEATAARLAATKAQEEQNRVIDELADGLKALAASHDRLIERLLFQQEHARERERDLLAKIEAQTDVIRQLSESVRNTGGIATDIRNHLSKQGVI